MRGSDSETGPMFSYVSLEARVAESHPLRPIRKMVDAALGRLSGLFDEVYARSGRPSIPPERLIRALLLQVLYSIRSERQLVEQIDYNLLFRWFVGLGIDDEVWDATTFTRNRDRLFSGRITDAFFSEIVSQARSEQLLSEDHFTVDGTVIDAWASHKSFVRKSEFGRDDDDKQSRNKAKRDRRKSRGKGKRNRNKTVSFHKERRSNATHASTTDPEARLVGGKGKESRLAYRGHVLTENRNGLVVQARLTIADGYAEREAALDMVSRLDGNHRATLGADKGYDTADFVDRLRDLNVTPHIAQNQTNRRSAIDGRTTRHPGYVVSQRVRKRVEEVFGWMKTVGTLRKTRHRGRQRVGAVFVFTAAAYNLVRMRNLGVAA
jgi:transposase